MESSAGALEGVDQLKGDIDRIVEEATDDFCAELRKLRVKPDRDAIEASLRATVDQVQDVWRSEERWIIKQCKAAGHRMDWEWFKSRFGGIKS